MNDKQEQELIAALRSLHPADTREVWQFVEMRILYHRADLRPPTAAQWERLTEWQRIRILWIASPRVAMVRVWDDIRSIWKE